MVRKHLSTKVFNGVSMKLRYFLGVFFLFSAIGFANPIDLSKLQIGFDRLDIDEKIDSNSKLYKVLQENSYDKLKKYAEVKELHKELLKQLDNSNIPPFFSYIPFHESGFNPKIKTKTVAGLWQLSAQTAKNFGLNVSKKNDERLDSYKSTEAIIKILKHYYKKYKKWYLADFAYGLGEGTLEKLIKRNGSDRFSVLFLDPKFPKGTKTHFATTILLEAQTSLSFKEKVTQSSKKEDEVKKSDPLSDEPIYLDMSDEENDE